VKVNGKDAKHLLALIEALEEMDERREGLLEL